MKRNFGYSNLPRGNFCRPAQALRIPVYLDEDVQRRLIGAENRSAAEVSKLVSRILHSQLGEDELLP